MFSDPRLSSLFVSFRRVLEEESRARRADRFPPFSPFFAADQAGNSIYDIFDKVMVIAAGQCIYW